MIDEPNFWIELHFAKRTPDHFLLKIGTDNCPVNSQKINSDQIVTFLMAKRKRTSSSSYWMISHHCQANVTISILFTREVQVVT